MQKILILLLASLFLDFFVSSIAGASIIHSGFFTPGKMLKLGLVYCLVIVFLCKSQRLTINRDIVLYLFFAMLIIIPYGAHILYADKSGGELLRAGKEVVRLGTLLTIFLLAACVRLRARDINFLTVLLSALALLISAVAVFQSLTGVAITEAHRVGELTRAGLQVTNPNYLAAFFNLFTFIALAGYFTATRRNMRAFYLTTAAAAFIARFFTFSNGSLLSLAASTLFIIVVARRPGSEIYSRFARGALAVVILLAAVMIPTGLHQSAFARLKPGGFHLDRSSIGSRIEQYEAYGKLVEKEPSSLLWGVGAADLPGRLTGLDLHNSYLRPLAAGGVFAFTGFLGLVYLCCRNFKGAIKKAGTRGSAVSTLSLFLYAAFVGWIVQAATLPNDSGTLFWFFFITGYVLNRTAAHEMLSRPLSD